MILRAPSLIPFLALVTSNERCWVISAKRRRPMDERERRHAIDVSLSQLDKQFGKGSVRGAGLDCESRLGLGRYCG